MTDLVQTTSLATRARGRPRSAARHLAVLEATRALLTTGGYEELTMEAIAAAAGVSKVTVYKWWPSKAAVVTEAVIAGVLTAPSVPPDDSGDVAADLGAWLHARFEDVADPAGSALIRAMTSASAAGNDAERLFRLLAEPHRQYLLRRLEVGVAQGQIRPEADLEATVDVIISVLLLQALTARSGEAHNRAVGLIDLLFQGLAQPKRRGRTRA